jgi:hypothetical protein
LLQEAGAGGAAGAPLYHGLLEVVAWHEASPPLGCDDCAMPPPARNDSKSSQLSFSQLAAEASLRSSAGPSSSSLAAAACQRRSRAPTSGSGVSFPSCSSPQAWS